MLPRKKTKTSDTLQSSVTKQKAWFQLWQRFSQKPSVITVCNILLRMSEMNSEEELRGHLERLVKWRLRLNFGLSLIRSNLFLPLLDPLQVYEEHSPGFQTLREVRSRAVRLFVSETKQGVGLYKSVYNGEEG